MDLKENLELVEESDLEEEPVVQDHPIFVAKTILDIHSQQEGSQRVMGKSSRGTDLVMYGMCLLMGVYLILDSIINHHFKQNAILMVLVIAIGVFTVISRKNAPKKAMEHWEQAIVQKYGSPALHVTTEFYNLSLVQTIQEDEEQFVCDGYSKVTEILESENLFLLRHGKNQYYFVAKNGFVKGTADEFRAFIQERIGGK